jgi:hypothetical protein
VCYVERSGRFGGAHSCCKSHSERVVHSCCKSYRERVMLPPPPPTFVLVLVQGARPCWLMCDPLWCGSALNGLGVRMPCNATRNTQHATRNTQHATRNSPTGRPRRYRVICSSGRSSHPSLIPAMTRTRVTNIGALVTSCTRDVLHS